MKPIIIYKFASRSRPKKFLEACENIRLKSADKEHYRIVATLDNDDVSMQFMRKYQISNLDIIWGESISKIHAINRGMPNDKWHILVNMSDDMEFKTYGFDEDIRDAFDKDFSLCLHYPDGNQRSLITMSILGRKFYDELGYIYNPLYTSLWSDNEQTLVSIMKGKYKFIDKQIFTHNHPAFSKGVTDEQYKHTESFYWIDKDVFDMRKAQRFGLETPVPSFYPFSNTPC